MTKTASSAVYNINYHLVWCPKYRKKILVGGLKEFLDQEITDIAKSKQWNILEMRVMPDHIHLFVSCDPMTSPTRIVKTFKGITANHTFKRFSNLRNHVERQTLESIILCWYGRACICTNY